MYLDFFGFSETPFSLSPNPRFIYFSKPHKEVFALLLYGIERRYGFIEITGEVGTGKTTVLRTLLSQLDEEKYRTALIFNPVMSAIDLLTTLTQEYGIECKSTDCAGLLGALNNYLLSENSAGRTVVLIIDEAQNLSVELLEQIRLISNLETDSEKLIQIVLAGQPELGRILERPELRQLNQRIALRYHLLPLDREDTEGYIDHRLTLAGGCNKVAFSRAALRWLYHYSRGTPRLINVLCDRALLVAYTGDRRKVTARTVALAFRDVMLKPAMSLLPALSRRSKIALASAVMVTAGLVYISFSGGPGSHTGETLQENKPAPTLPKEEVERVAKKPILEELKYAGGKLPAATVPKPETTPVSQPLAENAPAVPPHDKKLEAPSAKKAEINQPEQTQAGVVLEKNRTTASLQAFNAIAARLNAAPLKGLDSKAPLVGQLKNGANKRGLELDRFNGDFGELARSQAPALLELSSKESKGSQFAGITGYRQGKIIVQPPFMGKNVFSRKEIASVWTGRSYLLWRNNEKIRIPLTHGDTGNDVIRMQILLQAAGRGNLEVNGSFDEPTLQAVREFQRSKGLSATGKVGPLTLIQLYRAVTKPQSSDAVGGDAVGGR